MVYVDDMYKYKSGIVGRMRMSHMIADTTQELLDMATKIGIDHKHIQRPGSTHEHFDITMTKRAVAIIHGAKEITWKETVAVIKNKFPNQ